MQLDVEVSPPAFVRDLTFIIGWGDQVEIGGGGVYKQS